MAIKTCVYVGWGLCLGALLAASANEPLAGGLLTVSGVLLIVAAVGDAAATFDIHASRKAIDAALGALGIVFLTVGVVLAV